MDGKRKRAGGGAPAKACASRPAQHVDGHGFRPNVALVVQNRCGQVLWARRVGGGDAWQFPQGGIDRGETPEQALYRELGEEVGLPPDSVDVIARTRGWLRYRVPVAFRRPRSGFVGQKQRWFLLRLRAPDSAIAVAGPNAEFDQWRWVSYWHPVAAVVDFKRPVYRRALAELAPSLRIG